MTTRRTIFTVSCIALLATLPLVAMAHGGTESLSDPEEDLALNPHPDHLLTNCGRTDLVGATLEATHSGDADGVNITLQLRNLTAACANAEDPEPTYEYSLTFSPSNVDEVEFWVLLDDENDPQIVEYTVRDGLSWLTLGCYGCADVDEANGTVTVTTWTDVEPPYQDFVATTTSSGCSDDATCASALGLRAGAEYVDDRMPDDGSATFFEDAGNHG